MDEQTDYQCTKRNLICAWAEVVALSNQPLL